MVDLPELPDEAEFSASRVHFPAGRYEHAPTGLLQLRVVRQGSSRARIDLGRGAREVFTRPGDLLLSLPDRPTTFEIREGRELTIVQVRRAAADRILADLGVELAALAVLADRPFREPLVAELGRRLEALDPTSAAMRDWLLRLILGLLLDCARSRQFRVSRGVLTARKLESVLAVIDQRLASDISVDDLAAAAELPARDFSAAFRDATGLPVYQFVLRRRADRAVQLLTTTTEGLSEIAQAVGFSHQAHMSRVLKRLRGRTPGQFRKGR
jgi:AraC family transcriptional regulator